MPPSVQRLFTGKRAQKWKRKPKGCVKVEKAMYGLYRADRDYQDERHAKMVKAGWEPLNNHTYKKRFFQKYAYAGVYVDDTVLGGNKTRKRRVQPTKSSRHCSGLGSASRSR